MALTGKEETILAADLKSKQQRREYLELDEVQAIASRFAVGIRSQPSARNAIVKSFQDSVSHGSGQEAMLPGTVNCSHTWSCVQSTVSGPWILIVIIFLLYGPS